MHNIMPRIQLLPSSLLLSANTRARAVAFRASTRPRLFASTSTDPHPRDRRLFSEEVNIIYDSRCGVCKLEMDFLARRDSEKINVGAPRLKMTDLEGDGYDPADPANGGVTYTEGMAAIHGVTAYGKVVKGVPVFSLAYSQVGLGWLFRVTTWPIVKQLVDVGYYLFAKYRTNITRGASIDTLVKQYEAKRALQRQTDADDCQVCKPKKP